MAELLDRITTNPKQCGGRPCIRGMRIRVVDVLQLLAEGQSHGEILEAYPYLEEDDLTACLQYAARHPHHLLVERMRGRATEGMSTDEIMALTRGDDEGEGG